MSNLPARREDGTVARRGLYRDPEAGKVGGVCVGLERWTKVPAALWRIAFIGSTLLYGVGIPLYLILWTAMSKVPKPEPKKVVPSDLAEDEREIWDAVKKDMKSLDLEND